MKVLILSISAGQGHHQTSAALLEYLRQAGVDCQILDEYKYISPLLSDAVEKGYLFSTRYMPKAYGTVYSLMEKGSQRGDDSRAGLVANKLLTRRALRFIDEYRPDVIVCTHIFTAQSVTALKKRIGELPTIGIITDFTVHPFWNETEMDYYVTPTHLLDNQMKKNKIPQEKILPLGIPINPRFSQKRGKAEAKKQLGIEDKPTVLIMMGSMGYGNMAAQLRKLDRLDLDFQVISVCGKNKHTKNKIDHMSFSHRVYNNGYVDNVDLLMDAADLIVTKPGGLSVSESMAKGLPMLLINPIPGQEDRNMEFLLNNGLAIRISSSFPIDEAVYTFYSNEWRNQNMMDGVRYIGKPNSARDLGNFIISLGCKT